MILVFNGIDFIVLEDRAILHSGKIQQNSFFGGSA